eukprot:NODE_23_length_38171_cov_0.318108.p16 type:complete len:208 gc:universal NODE_23_length_38171_cov_0.318108:19422-18799(-)
MTQFKLYSYWRSSCSYRVRIVMNMKKLKYEYAAVNLLKNEQHDAVNLSRNPMGVVPTLQVDDKFIHQSMAIMEYLEDEYPQISMLPKDKYERAIVRGMCMVIVADTQPLQNLKVLKEFQDEKKKEWAAKVISNGLQAFERIAEVHSGKYSFGDHITFADACLVPQVYNATRFEIDIQRFPKISEIIENLKTSAEFEAADPKHMPDAQ